MTDIAEAAGLSRQSIYNQFGSKDAVLDWAVSTVLTDATQAALGALADAQGDPQDVIVNAFQLGIGDYVPIWRGTPHGTQILELAIDSTDCSEMDYEDVFLGALSAFLLQTGLTASQSNADDLAFLLASVAKGLLLNSSVSEEFKADMTRAVRVICNNAT